MGYCLAYTIVLGIGAWQTSWTANGNTNTTPIFEAKLEWDKDEAILYNTIISTAGMLGITIGSFLGGSILKFGRRRAVIISQSISMIGALISMFTTESTLTIGRLLLGTGGGCMNVTLGKLITENIPQSIQSSFAMAHNFFLGLGVFVVLLFGLVLPDQEDLEANKEDEMWRVIWLGPVAIGIFTITMTLFVMDLEPVAYCMMIGREDEGRKHLERLYRKKQPDSQENIEDILAHQFTFLNQSTALDASSMTFKDAVCGRKYRKGTWVCFMYNLFNQQSGITCILLYGNRLLVQMQEQGGAEEFPISPVQGTYIIGAAILFFAILVFFYIERIGRKPIMVAGQFFMSLFLFLGGLAVKNSWNMISFVMILLYLGAFMLSTGPIAWVYIPEVCVDAGSGLAVASQFMNATLLSFTFEYMINSELQVYGTFWYFSGMCFLGLLFVVFIVKETRGLTDLEKKTLYTPKSILDEATAVTELANKANSKQE